MNKRLIPLDGSMLSIKKNRIDLIVIILGSNARPMVWIAVPESARDGDVGDGLSFLAAIALA